jgi:hypothetical protein
MAESKAVAVKQESALPALPPADQLKEIFEANFEGIVPTFAAIKIPSGGAPVWMVPTDDGEPEAVKEIEGVIIDHYKCRAYWPSEFGGGNVPPECSSLDGKTGYKFGECAKCPHSQWGSGKAERGQACKSMHRVFVLRTGSDSIFPMFIPLPPTSAEGKYPGSLSTYAVALGGKLKKIHEVRTRIKLIQDKNRDGIAYSKAQFFVAGDLSEAEKNQVAALRDVLRPAMRSKPFEVDEAVEVEANGAAKKDPWES